MEEGQLWTICFGLKTKLDNLSCRVSVCIFSLSVELRLLVHDPSPETRSCPPSGPGVLLQDRAGVDVIGPTGGLLVFGCVCRSPPSPF